MKSFFVSSLIIISLLLFWLFINNLLGEVVEDLDKALSKFENHIIKENWTASLSLYEDINKKWKNSTRIMMLVIDHDEMEKVNYSLSQIKSYLKIKDRVSLIGEVGSLKYLVNHLKEKETLSLDNIF